MKKNKVNIFLSVLLLAITFAVTAFQTYQRLGQEHIKIWDEARGAVNAIEMYQDNNYIVQHFDGQPDRWNTKPPFFVWLKVISFKIFGINEFAVRFPNTVFALLTVALILFFSFKYLKEIYSGVIASLILANTPAYMGNHVVRTGEPDTILIFFVVMYALTWFILLEKYPLKRNFLFIIFSLSVFFAAFTKNIGGLAPLAGLVVYSIFRYKIFFKILKDYRLYLSVLSVIFLIVLYFFIREHFDPGYTKVVIRQEITGMFFEYFPGTPKHPEFSYYFIYLYNGGFYLYIYFLLLSIPVLFLSKNSSIKKIIVFSYIFLLAFLVGYSSSVAKNDWYISPVYPFLSLIVGISANELAVLLHCNLKKINKYLKYTLIVILAYFLFSTIYNQGIRTYKRNIPSKNLYNREFDGYYLKKYHLQFPEINEIIVISYRNTGDNDPNQDQVKFYIKKYNYLDGTNFSVTKNIDSLVGKFVLITDRKIISDIKEKYEIEPIIFDNNSLLCTIKNYKSQFKKDNLIYIGIGRSYNLFEIEYKKSIDIYKNITPNEIITFKTDYSRNITYYWLKDSTVRIFHNNTDSVQIIKYAPAINFTTEDIIDITIDEDNNIFYTFYKNNAVSSGILTDLDSIRPIYKTAFPKGYNSEMLIGCAIEQKSDHIFYWYNDGRASCGTSYNASEYKKLYNFGLPAMFNYSDIITLEINSEGNVVSFVKF